MTPSNLEVWTWIDGDGNETVLSESADNMRVLVGTQGRFMPPLDFAEDAVPLEEGTRYRETIVKPRDLDVGFLVEGASATALRSKLRALATTFFSANGEGRLRVLNPDLGIRELKCRYKGGFEGVEEFPLGVPLMRFLATFHAFDPYWQDAADQTEDAGNDLTDFFPFPPMMLSPTSILTDFPVTNNGDVESWPIWTITGPGENPLLENVTTGKSLSLAYTLAEGEQIRIDTRPGYKTITRVSDDENLYAYMDPGSALWRLYPGLNSVSLQMDGTNDDSLIFLAYRRRYLTV